MSHITIPNNGQKVFVELEICIISWNTLSINLAENHITNRKLSKVDEIDLIDSLIGRLFLSPNQQYSGSNSVDE
jgi:hypothetical protein